MSAKLDLDRIAKVLLIEWRSLPLAGGIYLAIDGAKRVWYVEQAADINKEFQHQDLLWQFRDNGVTHISWKEYEDVSERQQVKQELIAYYNPPLNNKHHPNRLPTINLGITPQQEIERYLEIKQMLAMLNEEMNELKYNIVSRLEDHGGKLETTAAKLSLQRRKYWRYSPAVDELRQELAELKKREEKDGTAIVTHDIVFPVVRLL